MLTIKGPIELKTNRPFTGHCEGFAERIEANYSVMGTKIEAEDLLHMVTSPPEIFIEEGGDINVLSSNAVFEGQSQKIEIVNNLMNRIVVDADYGLTYQDRVFIENVLSKLGVTDVKNFMKQVSNLQYDTIETAKLTNDYFSELAQNIDRIENIALSSEEGRESTETIREEREKAFYTSIMDRLKTAAIYQIVRNFGDTAQNNTISESLVRNSEQNFLTKKVLLNSLREDLSGERLPLTFRSEEYIEEVQEAKEELTDISVTRSLSASVLMEMVKNLYRAVFDKNEYREGQVYDFSKNFYRMGDNILSRISYRSEGNRFYEYRDFLESAGDEFENALAIFAGGEENNEERNEYLLSLQKTIENLSGDTQNIENTTAVMNRRIENASNLSEAERPAPGKEAVEAAHPAETIDREIIDTNTLEREIAGINGMEIRAGDRYTNEERNEYLLSLRKKIENLSGSTQNIENINTVQNRRIENTENLTGVSPQAAGEDNPEEHPAETIEREIIDTRTLERALSEINERNIRARDHYTEVFSELQRRAKRDSREGRTLTKKEALKALSDRNYRPEGNMEGSDLPAERDLMIEAVRDTLMEFPEGDINIYELMQRYNERTGAPLEAVRQAEAIQSLISDIRRVETVYREEPDVEKVAREAGEEAARRLAEGSALGFGQRVSSRREEPAAPKIDLVHKSENVLSEEEIRESLEEIRRSVKTERTDHESESINIISNGKKNEKRIEEVGADFMKPRMRTDAEIEAMISRGVKSQMSQISEQVIGKLAKKLQSDRSRRGL